MNKIYKDGDDLHGDNYDCYVFDFTEKREMAIYEFGNEKCFPLKNFSSDGRHFYLLHFVVSGEGKVVVGDKEYKVYENCVFLQKPNEKIFYEADKKNPWEYFWIGFNGTKAESIMSEIDFGKNGSVCTVPDPETFLGFFHAVAKCYKSKNLSIREIKAVAYLYLMLAHLQENFPAKNKMREAQENFILLNMLRYIETNYRKITVSSLASAFYYERSSVYRLFNKKLGVSPNGFLETYRLYRACHNLRNGNMQITEAAYSAGFNNYNWFFLLFKRVLGVSPENYLKLTEEERNSLDDRLEIINKAKTVCRESASGRHINLSNKNGEEQ